MANIIEMPKLSDTMTVGTLVKWLKKEGDVVKSGDNLAEVETDKATMELECFFDGTLLKIFAEAGSQVALGAPLCAVGKAGETVEAPASTAPAPAAKEEPKKEASAKAEAAPAPAASGEKKEAELKKPSADTAPAPSAPARAEGERVKISPLAKKLADEKGIDLSSVTGSGPGGRIVRADIEAAAKNPKPAASAKSGAPAASFSGGTVGAKGPIQDERTVTVSTMRGVIGKRLLESKTTIPHFYLEIEVDAEPLMALREQLNKGLEKAGVKLSVNDFILKGSAEALRRVPDVNAAWEGTQIRYFGSAHVSFAVALPDGLITPVVRDAHDKSIFQVSSEAKSLGKLAKDKKLKPDQFTGGTFCVSNLGMMGIPKFFPIINPPNAAILGVGTTVTKPVVKNGQIVIGQTLTLTLSADHRVVDGAVGAQFLAALKAVLESPALLLV
ncbi:pyruvate dehydrogenase complex dihydrolipoamide acetyltransferase [Rariglobus hedericola]|uniref:Acetyltransferase component of pyruvate dehydrogenase complex n=1 Tax=Rariglobus hedericola TaxID=2597822 RepID=A0A556QQE5_9BACT|nr:pyruvate dehydrogenase complex dihydrolipoamide acetyltransferase [Rariglobus hedericola]TSJ78843.1 pyruvate dehydrogenase complex dihydrolipoamide acetyltransferase [Rariglobus hedericola]